MIGLDFRPRQWLLGERMFRLYGCLVAPAIVAASVGLVETIPPRFDVWPLLQLSTTIGFGMALFMAGLLFGRWEQLDRFDRGVGLLSLMFSGLCGLLALFRHELADMPPFGELMTFGSFFLLAFWLTTCVVLLNTRSYQDRKKAAMFA